MQTLQRAVAEIRELEIEEIDLVAGGSFCTATSEVMSPTTSMQVVVTNGNVYTIIVQEDMAISTVTYFAVD